MVIGNQEKGNFVEIQKVITRVSKLANKSDISREVLSTRDYVNTKLFEKDCEFKVFEFIFVFTQGGPSNATQVLGTYIYLQAFNLFHMGYANALSVILLIIALLLGWLQLKSSRKA